MAKSKITLKTKSRGHAKSSVSLTKLAHALGQELKFLDMEANVDVLGTVAGAEADPLTLLGLNSIVQGDGNQERLGKQVRLVSIHLKGMCNFEPNDGAAPPTVPYQYVYLIRDKQTNGAQFNAEDVFNDPDDAELDVEAMRNLDFIQRFDIIKKVLIKREHVDAVWDGDSTVANGENVPWSLFAKLSDTVNFSATTGVIASITDVSYHIVMLGTANIKSQNRYVARLRFYG